MRKYGDSTSSKVKCEAHYQKGQHGYMTAPYGGPSADGICLAKNSTRPRICSAKSPLGQESTRPGVHSAKILLGQESTRPRFYSARSPLGQGSTRLGVHSAKSLLGQESARPSLLGQVCSAKDQYLAKNRKYRPTKIRHIRKRSAQIRNLRIIFQ